MLSLYRKFALDAVSIKNPRKIVLEGCEIYPNESRELICTNGKVSFTVAEDVYAYCSDGKALWYSKYEDLICGRDLVYRIEVNDVYNRRRGIIDSDGYFIFNENGYLYCENNGGELMKLCAIETVNSFYCLTGLNKGLTVKQIENALGAECGIHQYNDIEFYKDLNQLHGLISLLEKEKLSQTRISFVAAEIIAKTIKMCCEMNEYVSYPLERLIKKEI